MKSAGSYEAKTHLPWLLRQVADGESITITKCGKPIAVLAPAAEQPKRDIKALIAELRAYSKRRGATLGALSPAQIKEMKHEGRH
jgi:prevent-host-death family protein